MSKKLVDKGAKIMQTENCALIKSTDICRHKMGKSKNSKIMDEYNLEFDALVKKRDAFIAKTINDSLKENEIGLVFLWFNHNPIPLLAEDIKVIELKDKEKLAEYLTASLWSNTPEHLRKYLIKPVDLQGILK